MGGIEDIEGIKDMDDTYDGAGRVVSRITLAGGCFWGIEAGFSGVEGILATIAGYTGGDSEHPDYTQVSTGTTGHVEAVCLAYDPSLITTADILVRFFRLFDPTAEEGGEGDDGSQYRSFIFYHTKDDCVIAREFIGDIEASGTYIRPVVTVVRPAGVFWPAEDYHQHYYEKLGNRYRKPLF